MAKPLPSRGEIVSVLTEDRRALHAREIAARCRVSEGAYPRLLELLDQLTFDGTVRRMGGGRFRAAPAARQGETPWEGVLSVHPRGFGFVAAAGHDDVYVAADGIGGAMHGDRVRVRVIGRTSRGAEGRIEAIVTRRKPRVAGVLRRRRKSAWLEPDDTRIRGPVVLAPVPDDVRDGMAAVAKITRFPEQPGENPEGELVTVLGMPGEVRTEVQKILVREQIEEEHPPEAVAEAEARAARLGMPIEAHRTDLRHVPLLTIDPEDARDHDDAVYAERTESGYHVVVAIADVAEYVTDGSALDAEARARGCTIYLPDRAIPMLPSGLAADVCSLLPDQDRFCMAVLVDLDRRGVVTRYEVVEGLMRAAAMVSYGGAARALGFTDTPPPSPAADRFKRELKALAEVAGKLRRARMKRGSLDFDLPEARIVLDEETGVPTDIVRRAQDPGVKRAYQIVEELMILANELVARWLSKRHSPAIYRVHAKPDARKLERLGGICERLGTAVDLEQMQDPQGVAKWLAQIQEHPRRAVLEMLLLRSLKQAVYDIVNIGHFGLASEAYLHFTSPIRRYPDLLVHRTLKHLLRGGKVDTRPEAVEQLRSDATDSSTRERAAMEVEREVSDLYRALYMRDHVGEVFEGTVTGITGTGLFVSLDAPFVDVLVRFESLGPDGYELAADELGVVGIRSGDAITLGDRMTLSIEDVAVLRRTVYGQRVVPEKLLGEGKGRGRRGKGNAGDGERRGKGAPGEGKRGGQGGRAGRPRDQGRPARSGGGRETGPRRPAAPTGGGGKGRAGKGKKRGRR
jgi:ribonuclease R